MRDVERLREKVQFSLDGRQVWALGLSALLLIAGVFTVGLLVGRRTAPQAPPPSGDLAAMDTAAAREKPAPPVAIPARPPPPEPAAPAPEEKPQPPPAEEPVKAAAVVPAPRPPTVVQPPPKPVQVASAAPVALTPPPREVGDFTVQIGASQDRSEAQRMEAKARAAGLKPYVMEADLGAKGTWYRVRVGAFKDKEAANQYRRDVERELRATAVVMPSH